ncbi:MAG: 8-amino-7-oxononanoate synthase [Actinomycetota bacterium]|nr:8-amino-7-oxononanoate synthase [Actinomycetota bacterium]
MLEEGGAGPEIVRHDRRLVNLASNDYLGLATDPRLAAAAAEGAARWGVGATGSRLLSGNHPLHEALEEDIAASRGTEAALVFTSGYAANVGTLSALAGRHDLIVADALSHASLLDGARLSGARLVRYRHADPEHLEAQLRQAPVSGHRFVVTEGVFSMEGDVTDLPAVAEVAARNEATLIVDDAHGGGVVGPEGRGAIALYGMEEAVPVQIGTLSKALGCQGGYVAGSSELKDFLVGRARSFIFSTGLSPVLAAAARAALRIAREEGWRRTALAAHVRTIGAAARDAGLRVRGGERAPMLLLMAGSTDDATSLAEALESRGVLAPAIRPPTVPEGTSRLRMAPIATMTAAQLQRACDALAEVAR